MSAILSAEDLNDFISPGVACIKPVETLPQQKPVDPENPYEVTTEDKLPTDVPPAQISLTDCLACSGCVTSAEAVLVSLQSHAEVLNALDSRPAFTREDINHLAAGRHIDDKDQKRLFVASISPQVRASLAVTYGTTEREAGYMIDQLLCGPDALNLGGRYGSNFAWTVDTNTMREICLSSGTREVTNSRSDAAVKLPILTSACPGWICYAEKTHPHVLPHLSRLKSPQALNGILLKTVLSHQLRISPENIFHLAVMPCFDKKLEGSRQELTDRYWQPETQSITSSAIRDVDCVITAREILMLAESRNISFPLLPKERVSGALSPSFPDARIARFLFSPDKNKTRPQDSNYGTSGGYLYHILRDQQKRHEGSSIQRHPGRNLDVVDYTVVRNNEILFRAARYYGFRNIQNLVRKLKPAKISKLTGRAIGARKPTADGATGSRSILDYSYVEVMACPGGCTNGGGQIKFEDLGVLQSRVQGVENQKQWLGLVDEAYYSMSSDEEDQEPCDEILRDGNQNETVDSFVQHWSDLVGIPTDTLLYTSFREVVSDVGKDKKLDTAAMAEMAIKIGSGW